MFFLIRLELSRRMRWCLLIAVSGTEPASRCVNSNAASLRQELGAEVCHEDDDARELGDFRQTAKLVEKSEASGHLWTVPVRLQKFASCFQVKIWMS